MSIPSTSTSIFDSLMRDVLTQISNEIDISGGNISNTNTTVRTTILPRSQIEDLIYSAMSEEVFGTPPLVSRRESQTQTPPETPPETLRPSMTIDDDVVIENTIPYIPHSELYYLGGRYQQNMGDYINSINSSILLTHNIHNQRLSHSSSRVSQNQRFYELDNMLFDYNRNILNYNENVNRLLRTFENIPSSTSSQPSTPLQTHLQSTASARITTTPSQQTIPSLLNLLSRSDTPMYMLFPHITQRNGTTTTPGLTLSPEQFSRSTEQIIYSDISGNERERCPISFDEFQQGEHLIKILHCGHIFKTVPLNNWFLRSSTCPVCRYDLNTSVSPIGTSVDI